LDWEIQKQAFMMKEAEIGYQSRYYPWTHHWPSI
jgi:hypothetical protein